jgi:hypothetical protein
MVVPSQSDLKNAIELAALADLKQNNKAIMPALSDFMDHFCKDLSTCWSAWAAGGIDPVTKADITKVKFGGVTVSGMGIGAWSGTGSGGSFDSTITISLSSFYNTTDERKLLNSMQTRLTAAFNEWIKSFVFTAAPYTGSSNATTNNPGATTGVTNSPVLLSSSGTIVKFGTLSADIVKDLGYPMKTEKTAGSIIDKLTDAIQSGVSSQFKSWRTNSSISLNTMPSMTATAGTGTASGSSSNDGAIT